MPNERPATTGTIPTRPLTIGPAGRSPRQRAARFPTADQVHVDRTAKIARAGLNLQPGLPLARWQHIGEQIFVISDANAWWMGDWLLYGERTYPDRYQHAITNTRLDYQTLRNYAWVCRRFPMSRRRDMLSFQHHAEVARLPDAEQDLWLDRAAHFGWSRNALRRALRQARLGAAETSEQVSLLLKISQEQKERWQHAANRTNRTILDWVSEVLDTAAKP